MDNIQEYFKDTKDLSTKELKLANITSKELIEIYEDYLKSLKELETEGIYLSNRLQFCDEINSVRWRVKDPIHLLTKIVRKRKEAIQEENKKSKYLTINVKNYKEIITDLVGLRAIYLFKHHWKIVDDYVCSNFRINENENIIIYHASEDDLSFYYENNYIKEVNGFKLKYIRSEKSSKYRSTHYIIDANFPHNFKLELQIRSILDEAWGEIDHFLRYPDHEEDAQLKRQMTVLNGAINGCEELVTTYFKEFQERNIQILPEVKSEIKQMTQRDTSENTKTSKGSESENLDEKLKNLALYSDTSKYLKNLGIHNEFAKQQAILNEALSGPANVWAKQQAILNEALSGPANIWAQQQAALQNALVGPASTWAKQQAILQNNLVGPASILAKEQAILEASITESKNKSSGSSAVEEKSMKSKKKKSEDN
ncbi:hypothetical protein NQ912_02735 [Acinetobacter baumannii]|nr:hypothetical protein [Acinetobacter baumannii]